MAKVLYLRGFLRLFRFLVNPKAVNWLSNRTDGRPAAAGGDTHADRGGAGLPEASLETAVS